MRKHKKHIINRAEQLRKLFDALDRTDRMLDRIIKNMHNDEPALIEQATHDSINDIDFFNANTDELFN